MLTQSSSPTQLSLRSFLFLAFFGLITLPCSSTFAEEISLVPPIDTIESADSIDATLKQRDDLDYDPTRHSLFPDFYNQFRDWREEINRKFGLETTFSYDTLGQGYLDSSSSQGAASGDLSFTGRWLLFGQKYNKPVFLSFRIRHRHAYGEVSPSQLSSDAGLLWKTVDGFNDAGLQVPDLYISQELADRRLTLRYGQFSIDKFFDNHRLRSSKRFFLNQVFSANPSVAFPSYGAGFAVQWKDTRNWDFSIGGSNIQGTGKDDAINLQLNSSLFYTAQGSTIFSGIGQRDVRMQLMVWQNSLSSEAISDTIFSNGKGASLTFEHQGFSSQDHFVTRLAYSQGGASLVDRLLMVGWGTKKRKFDHFGVGLGVGRSTLDSNAWQGVTEVYYRWQITKELMITPDLQVIVGDGIGNDNTLHIVAGLRGGLAF